MALDKDKAAEQRSEHRKMLLRLVGNCLGGMAIGAVLACALAYSNAAGIGDRIVNASPPWLAALLFIGPLAWTFSVASVASYVGLLAYRKDHDRH